MKAGKLKKVLLPVLSLSLATMLTVMNVHATENAENESVNKKTIITESKQEVSTDENTTPADTSPTEGIKENISESVINEQQTEEFASIQLNKPNICIPVGGFYNGLFIELLDEQGNAKDSVKLTPDMVPEFDNTTLGTRQYTITYKGFTTPLTVEVVNMRLVTPNQTVPIGGSLNVWEKIQTVDADNPSRVFDEQAMIHVHNNENPAWYDKIDTSKAGVQEITFYNSYTGYGNVTLSGTIQVTVGTPSQITTDRLPSKAQATMPGGSYVGTWDVPSGEAGAGTWTFQTDLKEGTEVVVWSFHNNEWLKIGVYKVDAFGFVTVTFTADQLSPILITKNDGNSGSEVNNNTVSSNNYDSNVTTRTASPKTGDNASTILFGITALLSLTLISVVVYLKRKKISV